MNSGAYDEDLAKCDSSVVFGSVAFIIGKEKIETGSSPTEKALNRKAKKVQKHADTLKKEMLEKSMVSSLLCILFIHFFAGK